MCDEEYSPEYEEDLKLISEYIEKGHTEHCAQRQVWGDGECECNLNETLPAEKVFEPEHIENGKLSGKEVLRKASAFMSVLGMDPSIGMLFTEAKADTCEDEVLKKHGNLLGFEPDVKIRLKGMKVPVGATFQYMENNGKGYVNVSPNEPDGSQGAKGTCVCHAINALDEGSEK